jgi:hypothetical protein
MAQVKHPVAVNHHVGILQQVLCADRPEPYMTTLPTGSLCFGVPQNSESCAVALVTVQSAGSGQPSSGHLDRDLIHRDECSVRSSIDLFTGTCPGRREHLDDRSVTWTP